MRCLCVAALRLVALVPLLCGTSGCSGATSSTYDPVVLFQQHCARCHAQVGEPGGPRLGASQGPNLSNVGRQRSPEWIADYIRQPTNRRPNARMPAFGGTLSETQIRALADYLYHKSTSSPSGHAEERGSASTRESSH
ncbi:MAG: cytochrome c [Thermogemmata sp.]|nr:cytochrome c [Thermogemmata sp.]